MPAQHLPGGHLPTGHLPAGHLPGGVSPSTPTPDVVSDLLPGLDYGLRVTVTNERHPNMKKTPDETVLVRFAWASRLNGDTIDSIEYELPDGLTNEGEIGTGSLRSVKVSGGEEGRQYRVLCRIVTDGGQTLELTQRVLVMEG